MSQVQEAPASRLTRYRHEESENYVARGVECLLLAEEGGYTDKSLLTEACDSFMEAIKFNRQHTEAYVGMAYLLWLLGDHKQALTYLEQGLRTQPSHPDVHRMIQQISGRKVTEVPSREQISNQRVLELVKALLAEVETENLNTVVASVNAHKIERLQERVVDWELKYDEVLQAIDQLEAFHERVMLTCELGPVQDRILAYHQALKQSERMLQLDDKIQQHRDLAKELLEQLESGQPGMYEASMDMLLDTCDLLADELEVLEKEGLNVGALDSHYQQLVDHVEALQGSLGGAG